MASVPAALNNALNTRSRCHACESTVVESSNTGLLFQASQSISLDAMQINLRYMTSGAPETTRGRGQAGNRGPGLPQGIFYPLRPPARIYTPSFEHIPHS